jgi:hypothetical protein
MGNGILDRFIVTCDSDLKVLNKIREKVKCGRDCGVFQQTPSRRYEVPGPAVPGTETIASVISVTDDLVYNCLGACLHITFLLTARLLTSLSLSPLL